MNMTKMIAKDVENDLQTRKELFEPHSSSQLISSWRSFMFQLYQKDSP